MEADMAKEGVPGSENSLMNSVVNPSTPPSVVSVTVKNPIALFKSQINLSIRMEAIEALNEGSSPSHLFFSSTKTCSLFSLSRVLSS